ncbi:uncharacterized protein LOC112690752 isoform X4 [Sipha flava]|nr:uncharacterized protein LOC112690752 isoform X4 [Sipha flava]XP_025420615.1 uncharacterized protein LOC112690752 isoform X4 [Sipha flava]XP_025420616.1 uncharacterized protein LOC112690752 isoform X4 [Sipha flava]
MEMETDSGDKKKIVVGQPLNERFAISQNGKSETIGLALDVTLVPVVMFMSGKGVGLTKKEHDSNTASPTEAPEYLLQRDINLRLTQRPIEADRHHFTRVVFERRLQNGIIKQYREILTAEELRGDAVTRSLSGQCNCNLCQNDF